jgi:hypothetical protein
VVRSLEPVRAACAADPGSVRRTVTTAVCLFSVVGKRRVAGLVAIRFSGHNATGLLTLLGDLDSLGFGRRMDRGARHLEQ